MFDYREAEKKRPVRGRGKRGPFGGRPDFGAIFPIKVRLVRRVTGRALQVMIGEAAEGKEFMWFPRSQILNANAIKAGDEECELRLTEWIARKKGLL